MTRTKPITRGRVRYGMVLSAFIILLAAACAENEAATAKCKSATTASEECQKCCNSNGANGYKFMNGTCACLGG